MSRDGAYLIRTSTSHPGDFVLSVKSDKPRHFHIRKVFLFPPALRAFRLSHAVLTAAPLLPPPHPTEQKKDSRGNTYYQIDDGPRNKGLDELVLYYKTAEDNLSARLTVACPCPSGGPTAAELALTRQKSLHSSMHPGSRA